MGKNWAISVGINKYSNLRDLKYAKADAEAMADWLGRTAKFDEVFLFTKDSPPISKVGGFEVNPPIPTEPNFGHLRRFLRAQFENPLLQPEDNLWFFFAGHGKRERDKDYLLLSDSDPGDVEYTAISVDYVTQRLRRSGADNVVLFLDACREESSRSGWGIGEEKHQGVITFYSCTAKEQSYEIEELKHGSFTYTLLEGLKHQGESNCATVERLSQYLRYQLPRINETYGKAKQNPYLKAEPPYKMYFILLEQSATLKDVEPLKYQASLAENRGNLLLAKQLWIRVLAVSRADWDAIDAIERIALRQDRAASSRQERVVLSPENMRGERALASENSPVTISNTELQTFSFEVLTVDERGVEVNRERGQAQYFTEDLGNDVGLDMVYIPGGKFMMGSPEGEGYDWEKPQHEVKVKFFFMGKFQITQAQWRVIVSLPKVKVDLESDPSHFKGDERPVESVSWDDAVEFCQRLSQQTGKEYRLPSEAEWEYACRAGTTTPFHFGENITHRLANYGLGPTPTAVGSFSPNAFGSYHMHGNVFEWCEDNWHENYQDAPTDGSAWTSGNNSKKVIRGGSWNYDSDVCRSAYRDSSSRVDRSLNIGFRVVCVASRTT